MLETLRAEGVETLAIINTPVERARLYARYRPTRLLLLADPDAATHRAYGLPAVEVTAAAGAGPSHWPLRATMDELRAVRINPTDELADPKDPFEAASVLNQKDGFQVTEVDQQVAAAHGTQLAGHFLIGRDGVVHWTHVEAWERMTDLAKFPSAAEFLAAARALKY